MSAANTSRATGDDVAAASPGADKTKDEDVVVESDGECPICMEDSCLEQMVVVSCGHSFCEPCLQRHLMAVDMHDYKIVGNGSGNRNSRTLVTHCLGMCPLCRASISWFDAERSRKNKQQQKRQREQQRQLVCSNQSSWRTSPLAGSVYAVVTDPTTGAVAVEPNIGCCSLHFPPSADAGSLPAVDLSKLGLKHDRFGVKHLPRAIFFERAHFDEPSRTFFGKQADQSADSYIYIPGQERVLLPRSDTNREWLFLVTFSHDYRFVTRGALYEYPVPFLTQSEQARQHPLDGAWEIRLAQDADDCECDRSITVSVVRALYIIGGESGDLTYRLSKHGWDTILITDQRGNVQRAKWDWLNHPRGPVQGQRLFFHDTMPQTQKRRGRTFPAAVWIRKKPTVRPANITPNVKFRIGVNIKTGYGVLRRLVTQLARTSLDKPIHILDRGLLTTQGLPIYNSHSVWGNAFWNGDFCVLGHESQHFVSEEEGAYVSFEHAEAFIKMASIEPGKSFPNRIYLRNLTFTDKYTLRGQLLYKEEYGITFCNGVTRRDICMKFDSTFACIVDGSSSSITSDGTHLGTVRYNDDIIYTNAGLYTHFRDIRDSVLYATSHAFSSLEQNGCYRPLQELYFTIAVPRLQAEGVSPKTLRCLTDVFQAAATWSFEDPGDYNLV